MGRVSQDLERRAPQAAIPGEREDPASLRVRVQGGAQSLEQERDAGGRRGPLGLQGTDAGLRLPRHPAQYLRDTVYLGHGHSARIWRPERKGENFMDPIKWTR